MITFKTAYDSIAWITAVSTTVHKRWINEAVQRILNYGKYKGSLERAIFVVDKDAGQVTLPRRYSEMIAFTTCKVPQQITNYWYTSLPGSLGDFTNFNFQAIDLGDGYPLYRELPSTSYLRFTIADASDATKIVALKGNDQDGNFIYNATGAQGITVALVNPTVTTSQQFDSLVFASKVVTEGYITVSAVDVNDATVTQVGLWEPGETNINLRRYRLPLITDSTDQYHIEAICKKRWIEAVNDNDELPIGNLSALKNAVLSIYSQETFDEARREYYWNKCLEDLNEELSENYGASGSMGIQVRGYAAGTIANPL